MDQVQPSVISCSSQALSIFSIAVISIFSMCHCAIKDQPPNFYPDHVATVFSPLDTNPGSDRKKAPCTGNCEPHTMMEVKIESLLKTDDDNSDDVIYKINRTEGEASQKTDIAVKETQDFHHWKVKVIIVCTIAASIEIVIVILILIYWKDIRWSMRKMYCPCDERRVRRRDHEAMEPSGPSPSDSGFQGDDLEQGHQVLTYQTRRSEVNDPLEDQTVMQTSVV